MVSFEVLVLRNTWAFKRIFSNRKNENKKENLVLEIKECHSKLDNMNVMGVEMSCSSHKVYNKSLLTSYINAKCCHRRV